MKGPQEFKEMLTREANSFTMHLQTMKEKSKKESQFMVVSFRNYLYGPS